MSKVLVEEQNLSDIADSIRAKNGTQETYKPSEMSGAIDNLPSGGGADEYFNTSFSGSGSNNIDKIIKKLPAINTGDSRGFRFSGCSSLVSIEGITVGSAFNSMASMFYECNSLKTIPLFNTSNVTDMSYCFRDCINIQEIPPFDTSKVTNMNGTFSTGIVESIPLTTVPLFDTSKVTNFTDMFLWRSGLNTTSLDNILQMCINATSYNGTKTLAKLGLKSEFYSTSTIESLPHYQDFIDAGWTVGY